VISLGLTGNTSASPATTSGTAVACWVDEFGHGLGVGWHGQALWSLARRVERVGGLGVALEHAGGVARGGRGPVQPKTTKGGTGRTKGGCKRRVTLTGAGR
jgi:hypothetical protein